MIFPPTLCVDLGKIFRPKLVAESNSGSKLNELFSLNGILSP